MNTDSASWMDSYHQRMTQIQDISNTVNNATQKLDEVLKKFGWARHNLKLEKKNMTLCNVDSQHIVKKEVSHHHNKSCFFRKIGITSLQYKDIPPVSLFAYTDSNSVVPVNLDESVYQRSNVQINIPGFKLAEELPRSTLNLDKKEESLIELNEEMNNYVPSDPLDELRFIYSWSLIPRRYLKVERSDHKNIYSWVKDHLPERLCSGVYFKLIVDAVCCCDNPDDVSTKLKLILGNDTTAFVLSLWKYMVAKAVCLQHHISEHTRNEFDNYGLAPLSYQMSPNKDDPNTSPAPVFSLADIPMEWIYYNLSREQKLSIYEEVCKIKQSLCVPSLQYSELQADASEQMKVLTSLESSGEKTRLEIMAEMRDYKRRRQSYRGKNASNAKLTALEVLREIVDQQMLYLDIINGRTPSDIDNKPCGLALNEQFNQNDKERKRTEIPSKPKSSDVNNGGEDSRNRGRRSKSRDRHNRRRDSRDRRSKSRDRRNRSRSRSHERRNRSHGRRNRSRDRRNRSRERRSRSREKRSLKQNHKIGKEHGNSYSTKTEYTVKELRHEVSNVTYYGKDSQS